MPLSQFRLLMCVCLCEQKHILFFPLFRQILKGDIPANTALEIKEAKLTLYFNLIPFLCLSYGPLYCPHLHPITSNLVPTHIYFLHF